MHLLHSKNALTLLWVRWGDDFTPLPLGFPLITKKLEKLQPWYLAAFNKILLEIFVPNLVSLTHLSLQILGKTQTGGISDFQISGNRKLS